MKVILLQDVKSLGRRDDIVEVKDGYARNFLVPNDLAVLATSAEKKKREERRARIDEEQKRLEELRDKIEQEAITIPVAVNEEGTVFGGVQAHDIQGALNDQKYNLPDDFEVALDAPLKETGAHEVPLKLGRGISANITVNIIPQQ